MTLDQVTAPYFVGIDVAKDRLDLSRSDDTRPFTFDNDQAGITGLVKSLASNPPVTIVVESTGGIERPLLDALLEAGLPVALVNPGNVRLFARGLGIKAKTDPIDAAVLARFAEQASPRLLEKRSANQAELDALVSCRRQLVESRTAHSNRRGSTHSKAAIRALDAVLRMIQTQIDNLDRQIKKLIESDDRMNPKSGLLQTVPGVGAVLGATLIAELGELGATDPKRIAALVGVAPFNDDSGHRKGKRSIRGGRTNVRCTLFMGILSAVRHNPVIKNFADRLLAAGKAKMIVQIAAVRKLLTLMNAMLRDNLRWEQLDVVKALAN